MKQKLILLIFLIGANWIHAQVFDTEKIKDSGDNDKRLNLVILSEGYQASEFDKFKTDAESIVNAMFSQSPFLEYSNYFNVHIIKVPSNESGADHPGTAVDVTEPHNIPVSSADTYFNATYDAFGYHRFLYYGIDYNDAIEADLKINAVLAANFPTYDQALIVVNSAEYGGTGGEFPIVSNGPDANELAIHELGHSMFNLKDEYVLPDAYYGEAINMTQENNISLVKWKNWINTNGINVYQHGTTGVPAAWYRPHQNCKMRYLGVPFCSVCKEGMVEKIHDLISPVESFSPNNKKVNNPSFPVNFVLNLIKPQPNTLTNTWTLNGNYINDNVDAISIVASDLEIGENVLIAVIEDDSNLVDVDNHNLSSHIYTVQWTINYSTLGIENIKGKTNEYRISLYPIPAKHVLNVKIESANYQKLSIKITSMDGKVVSSIPINSPTSTQIDISHLSTGIYVANFYSGTSLISSERLVKN
ncbi:M64 family metallopeptidase [Algibacter mikhailovii]|uniref:Secretion system C-terminal sorting domain-containing protein n=1 Tax=Algibacter mikhailovii TaxID=425498 RepID=A0A918R0G2_9FLAO|nr:M64 family metallopeptidase [Algibacter mikhailovii]GGZ79354.1 hypothetical protein GCM10007028_16130 [Algibacter mikhailovii]